MKVFFSADELQQVFLEFAPGLLVDRRERLVHQQHVGLDRERAGEADALAHAAGQLMRISSLEALQADFADVVLRDGLALGLRHAAQLEAESRRCASRSPRAAARNPGTRKRARGRGLDTLAVPSPAGAGRQQARDDLEQGGLAATATGRAARSACRPGNRGDVAQRLHRRRDRPSTRCARDGECFCGCRGLRGAFDGHQAVAPFRTEQGIRACREIRGTGRTG